MQKVLQKAIMDARNHLKNGASLKTLSIKMVCFAIMMCVVVACKKDDPEEKEPGDKEVTFVSVTANGSEGSSTTELTLTFSEAIEGLAAADITVGGGTIKGALTGAGPEYKLAVTATSSGSVPVSVSKTGYQIEGSPKNVNIFFDAGFVNVVFSAVAANGSATETTTALTLTFDVPIVGLAADDFNVTVVGTVRPTFEIGELQGEGPVYTLPIEGFYAGTSLTVELASEIFGYTITGGPFTTTIHKAGIFIVDDFESKSVGTNYPQPGFRYGQGANANNILEVISDPEGESGKVLHIHGTNYNREWGYTGVHNFGEFEVTLPAGKTLGDYKTIYLDWYFFRGSDGVGPDLPNGGYNYHATEVDENGDPVKVPQQDGAGWYGWGTPEIFIGDGENYATLSNYAPNVRNLVVLYWGHLEGEYEYWGAREWARGIPMRLGSHEDLDPAFAALTSFKVSVASRSGAVNYAIDNVILSEEALPSDD